MPQIAERYRPVVIGANATATGAWNGIGGFLALTSGTLTVVDSNGTTILNAVPVTAGVYTPAPFLTGGGGSPCTATTAGGASGTLGVH